MQRVALFPLGCILCTLCKSRGESMPSSRFSGRIVESGKRLADLCQSVECLHPLSHRAVLIICPQTDSQPSFWPHHCRFDHLDLEFFEHLQRNGLHATVSRVLVLSKCVVGCSMTEPAVAAMPVILSVCLQHFVQPRIWDSLSCSP